MTSESEDVRCVECGKLLGRLRAGVLTIRRGELQVTIDGDFHAAFVCYQPRCRRLNAIRVRSQDPGRSHPPRQQSS
jgi:phage FluMu protein Com